MKKLLKNALTILTLINFYACGADDGEYQKPGNVDVAGFSYEYWASFDELDIRITFKQENVEGSLMMSGWKGAGQISNNELERCDPDESRFSPVVNYLDFKNVIPGKYYVRICAYNTGNDTMTLGKGRWIEIEEPDDY